MRLSRGQAATTGFAALMLLFVAVAVTATGYHLAYLRAAEVRRLQDMAATHARVFEDHVTHSLNVVDLTLRNTLDAGGGATQGNEALARALRRAPYLRSLSLLDAEGHIVASSNPDNVGIVPRLDALLPDTAPQAPLLRVGRPWAGRDFADGRPATPEAPVERDGLAFLPLVRALEGSERMLVAVNPDYFVNHFIRALPATEGVVEVIRLDGVLLLSSDEAAGSPLAGMLHPATGWFGDGPGAAPQGLAEDRLEDGAMLDVAFRASRLYPLTVLVRMERELALRAWREQARTLLTVVVPAFVLSLVLAVAAFGRIQRIERERQEEELRAHDRLAGRVFEASTEAIMVTDHVNRIVRINRAYTLLSGYSEAEALGRDPNINRSGQQDGDFYAAMWRDIQVIGAWQGELINRRKDGSLYPVALTISAVRDEAGRVMNYVGLFTDITERRAREDRIRFLSEHDALTGLPNRALLQDRVAQAIAQARRGGNRLAILFVDLDSFKPINDSLGHHVGDRLLQEVARRLLASVRESDTVGRQGGDEFLVMLPDIAAPEDAARVAEKLIAAVAEPCLLGSHVLQVSASIGISIYPDDGSDLPVLVHAADSAMYRSKSCGRAAYCFHSESMNPEAVVVAQRPGN